MKFPKIILENQPKENLSLATYSYNTTFPTVFQVSKYTNFIINLHLKNQLHKNHEFSQICNSYICNYYDAILSLKLIKKLFKNIVCSSIYRFFSAATAYSLQNIVMNTPCSALKKKFKNVKIKQYFIHSESQYLFWNLQYDCLMFDSIVKSSIEFCK